MMAGEFDGKVALVTGGGSGIGEAACLEYARRGAAVGVADRFVEAAERTVKMIEAEGGRAVALQADVSKEEEVQRMVDQCVDALGGLNFAFNNAGIGGAEVKAGGVRLGDIRMDQWEKIIGINLTGVWLCMRAEIAVMLKNGGGAIVNTASMAGTLGLFGSGTYSASKHGVIGLTKAAAVEYGADGIRVNAVNPGYVETPLVKDTLSRNLEKVMVRLPMKRLAQPSEIAKVAAWLCSDGASYVNGMAYGVDGGYTAG